VEATSLQPHRGALILVLGVLSLTSCVPLGVVAWILGNRDLRAMQEGRMETSGRDLTQAGMICGIVGTFFFIVVVVLIAIFVSVPLAAIE
jgi:ABC-type phosphate transport system permease subunit